MALPVIPNVFRVTWNFASYQGVTPRCVQHFLTATADGADLGVAIWEACEDSMFFFMHQNFEPQSLSIIRLDGTSATVEVPRSSHSDAEMCATTGEIIPAAAAVISWRSLVRGPKGRGRTYVGPVSESAIQNGKLIGDGITLLPLAWTTFMDNLTANTPNIELTIASYRHEESYLVSSFSMSNTLATQRRRQDQLR